MAEAMADTSVLIDLSGVDRYAKAITVSAVSVAELAAGLRRSDDPVEQARRQRKLEALVSTYEPVPFTTNTARIYGALSDAVRGAGRNPRPRSLDLMIAATAAELAIPIITRNARDLAGIERFVKVIAVA